MVVELIIKIPQRYKDELKRDEILEILNYLNIDEDYKVELVSKNGRNIEIITSQKRYYIIFSAREAKDSRNAFLNQYISTVMYQFMFDETPIEKELCVYLLDTSKYASANYIVDTYRMLLSMGIRILNLEKTGLTNLKAYESIGEWKEQREERKNYNKGNKSTYVVANVDSYYIYGKTFGANQKETALICCFVAKIAKSENKEVRLYQVIDNNSKQLSKNDLSLIKKYGVVIAEEIIETTEGDHVTVLPPKKTSRDQGNFYYQLLQKYGSKKCYICGNEIEETIVASHIHRITDIDNSTTMTEEEKNIAAIDSDNGFWLCANHDKMFENGLFYFLDDKLIISNDIKGLVDRTEKYTEKSISNIKDGILQNNIRALVYRVSDELVLKNFKIEPIHYTPKMHHYLEIHRHRVKGF